MNSSTRNSFFAGVHPSETKRDDFNTFCNHLQENHPSIVEVRIDSICKRFGDLLQADRAQRRHCTNTSPSLMTRLVQALSKNQTIGAVTIDPLLFEHDDTCKDFLCEYLTSGNSSLIKVSLRDLGEDLTRFFQAAAASPSVTTLHIQDVSRPIDMRHLTSNHMTSLSIRTRRGIEGFSLKNHTCLQFLELHGTLSDAQVHAVCQEATPQLEVLRIESHSGNQAQSIRSLLQSPLCGLQELDLIHSRLDVANSQKIILEGVTSNTTLTKLGLQRCGLAKTGLAVSAWKEVWEKNTALRTIDLAWNHLRSSDAIELANMLRGLNSATKVARGIDLRYNLLDSSGVAVLMATLPEVPNLESLLFGDFEIANLQHAEMVRDGLVNSTRLKHLNMGRLFFQTQREAVTETLLQGLVENTHLESLELERFGQSPLHVRDLLLGLKSHPSLQKLVLRDSAYEESVCSDALADFMQGSNLVELDLSKHASMGHVTVEALANGLRTNKTLQSLRLCNCPLASKEDDYDRLDQAWKDLAHAFKTNDTLTSLDLSSLTNQVDTLETSSSHRLVELLSSECFAANLSLEKIKLAEGFRLNPDSVKSFLRALKANTHVEEILHLDVSDWARANVKELHYILKLNKTGRRFMHSSDEPLLWPRFLARIDDPAIMHYFVTQRAAWVHERG